MEPTIVAPIATNLHKNSQKKKQKKKEKEEESDETQIAKDALDLMEVGLLVEGFKLMSKKNSPFFSSEDCLQCGHWFGPLVRRGQT